MVSVTKTSASKNEDDIDLSRLVGEFIDHRKLIISVTSLFTVIALVYALFATPIYQADALIQVEQKQANAILTNLSQMLPDSQPQSAPEIALLQSRMVLGKTVDDLNLQARITPKYFPILGRGWARLTGTKNGELRIAKLFIPGANEDYIPKLQLNVIDNKRFEIVGDDFSFESDFGKLTQKNGVVIDIANISAKPGD
ncbi:tyrosine-protein kinase, partial [Escherichia coli]|nr:tyrosine-protein kinase [Escherichia coli]